MTLDLRQLLLKNGLKITSTRLAILTLLAESTRPIGITSMTKQLEEQKISHPTIYRNILKFVRAGIVRPVHLLHGHVDYELIGHEDTHRIICVSCKKLETFTHCGMEDLMASLAQSSKSFAVISNHALEFFGICKTCHAVKPA